MPFHPKAQGGLASAYKSFHGRKYCRAAMGYRYSADLVDRPAKLNVGNAVMGHMAENRRVMHADASRPVQP